MKRRFLWLAIAALAIGVAVVLYRGPGRGVIRGHVGDGAATMLVYAVLGLIWRARPAVRAAAALAIAAVVELGQTVWHGQGFVGEMTIGGTFDGWDFVAYAIGVAVAVAWERAAPAADQRRTAARLQPSHAAPYTVPMPASHHVARAAPNASASTPATIDDSPMNSVASP